MLDVGCGTGHFTRWLAGLRFDVTGLDNAPAMLHEARTRGGAPYIEADAHALPFPSHTVDLTTLVTTLEFVDDPPRVLSEAIRVARRGVILGVLNRVSLLACRRRLARTPTWNAATFFDPSALRSLVHRAGGSRVESITWRTTLWPWPIFGSLPLPWGGFIGMAVTLASRPVGDNQ
jgi:ubiquinone/menaquinone biosynthesis C-methylase UbiE